MKLLVFFAAVLAIATATEQPKQKHIQATAFAGSQPYPGIAYAYTDVRDLSPETQQSQVQIPSQGPQQVPSNTMPENPAEKPVDMVGQQYFTGDSNGQYSFSYVNSAGGDFKHETRGADGTIVGSYGYILPDGRRVEHTYSSDGKGGVQVHGAKPDAAITTDDNSHASVITERPDNSNSVKREAATEMSSTVTEHPDDTSSVTPYDANPTEDNSQDPNAVKPDAAIEITSRVSAITEHVDDLSAVAPHDANPTEDISHDTNAGKPDAAIELNTHASINTEQLGDPNAVKPYAANPTDDDFLVSIIAEHPDSLPTDQKTATGPQPGDGSKANEDTHKHPKIMPIPHPMLYNYAYIYPVVYNPAHAQPSGKPGNYPAHTSYRFPMPGYGNAANANPYYHTY